MAWDFSTDDAFEADLAWMRTFVKEEIAPLDLVFPHYDHQVPPPWLKKVIDPLKNEVKGRGCGRVTWAPISAARASAR